MVMNWIAILFSALPLFPADWGDTKSEKGITLDILAGELNWTELWPIELNWDRLEHSTDMYNTLYNL